MGFLKNIIQNAVSDGISKGIRDAVNSAAEKVLASKVAESAAEPQHGSSSVEESLNRMSHAAEKYAAAMEKTTKMQESMIREWNEKLPGFPVWCFGGTDFWFSDCGTTSDGNTYYVFNAEGTTQEGLDLYVALLKQNGFVRKYKSSDEVLYKDLGGEYLVFGKTDAFGSAPVMTISMVRTRDRSEIEC